MGNKRRYKHFRTKDSKGDYEDEWGDVNEERQREKRVTKYRKESRKNKREDKVTGFKNFNDK